MGLAPSHWAVIILYLLFIVSLGVYFKKQTLNSLEQYLVAGRQSAWWLAGTSMLATGFAPDTPLGMTGLVVMHGVAGYWWNWSNLFGTMLTVVVFARLWQRIHVLTDAEFIEIRYSGRPAAFLRGFRAFYFGIPMNCLTMGWVNLAMVKILKMTLGVTYSEALALTFALLALTTVLAASGGLRGVFATDFVQYIVMMGSAILLAYFAVDSVGGLQALMGKVKELDGGDSRLGLFPEANSTWMPLKTFLVFIGVRWWASAKSSSGPDGGGNRGQRLMACRGEGHAVGAVLLHSLVSYGLRPWPWILVALVSMVAYPGLADPESGYVLVMMDVLPAPLLTLMLAGFAAAYVSTISTLLNWGAGYFAHDFYGRFLNPSATEKQRLRAARLGTVLLAVLAGLASLQIESVSGGWKLLVTLGAGTGMVTIIRWFWWRINAWSEVSAMIGAAAVSLFLQRGLGYRGSGLDDFATVMLITVSATTAIWLTVTFLTPPEKESGLISFYRRVRPYPTFWGPIAAQCPDVPPGPNLVTDLFTWMVACGLSLCILSGIGYVVIHNSIGGWFLLAAAALLGVWLRQRLRRLFQS